MRSITLNAHAKLNLTLDILGLRSDGYHDLSMVMQSISLCDTLHVALTEGADIVCRVDGADLPADESNLAVKAARAFFRETALPPCGLSIEIEKRIPIAAGMAGGSADAAAVLHALRELLMPAMELTALERIGETVGSDVPFCVRGGTALAEGRGELLTSLSPAPKLSVVVCKPPFPISTPVLFKRSDSVTLQKRPDTAAMLRAIAQGDADGMIANLCNVFEEVLPEECGEVFTIRDKLLALGADGAQMTGSGPTVFGLFKDEALAAKAAETLKKEYEQSYLCEFV